MHAYAAWLCMQKPEFSTPRRTSTGAARATSCICIKSAPGSGQAWRGEHCALAVGDLFYIFDGATAVMAPQALRCEIIMILIFN